MDAAEKKQVIKDIYKARNGRELLEIIFNNYDIRALDDETLIKVLDEMFMLSGKTLNILEKATLSGRIKHLSVKYQLKTRNNDSN